MEKEIGTKEDRFEVLLEDIGSTVTGVAEQTEQLTKDMRDVKQTLAKQSDRLDTIEVNIEFIKHMNSNKKLIVMNLLL